LYVPLAVENWKKVQKHRGIPRRIGEHFEMEVPDGWKYDELPLLYPVN